MVIFPGHGYLVFLWYICQKIKCKNMYGFMASLNKWVTMALNIFVQKYFINPENGHAHIVVPQ